MRAVVDGVTFSEWPEDFDSAYVIEPGGLAGWFGGTSIRRDESARPIQHGAFDSPGYLAPRVITISGNILASSYGQLQRMKEQLSGLLADGNATDMTVDDGERYTSTSVRLASLSGPDETSEDTATFQLQLWAPDPFRYGERRVFSGRSVLPWHRGNADAVPVCTVSAEAPTGYTISYRGHEFRVSGAKSAAVTDVIDMRTGWVRRNGSVLQGVVAAADVFTVPRGEPSGSLVISGAPSVSVELYDTYI